MTTLAIPRRRITHAQAETIRDRIASLRADAERCASQAIELYDDANYLRDSYEPNDQRDPDVIAVRARDLETQAEQFTAEADELQDDLDRCCCSERD